MASFAGAKVFFKCIYVYVPSAAIMVGNNLRKKIITGGTCAGSLRMWRYDFISGNFWEFLLFFS